MPEKMTKQEGVEALKTAGMEHHSGLLWGMSDDLLHQLVAEQEKNFPEFCRIMLGMYWGMKA